ncbi:hypothetical protein ACIRRH_42000 [Kitasatospora sp. NPDC101235]|uniref:hypothetical protein n=1 Tax=Kitasatospora sp. NPDC101235 TaxID=3364101 RepID=UPI00380DC7F2
MLAEDPGDQWADVASVLADACETFILRPTGPPAARQLARLERRLRATGATLLTPIAWPGTAELRLTAGNAAWEGVGDGHGALRVRTVTARCTGRGRAARPREARPKLPDEHGGVSVAAPVSEVAHPVGEEAVVAALA